MVPFASYVSRGQSKPRLIFSRINGPNKELQAANLFGLDRRAFKSYLFFTLSKQSQNRHRYLLQNENLKGSVKVLLLRF